MSYFLLASHRAARTALAAPFRTALAKAATAARGHTHVLVEGESGTGKDMVARAMHAASTRAKANLRVVRCRGLPAASLESLLFGHEQGAFAGAFDRQTGLLEQCDGGTLILDDVDRIPRDQQERLADVLDSGIVRPTGATHGFKIDLRVFATSDHVLEDRVAAGQFELPPGYAQGYSIARQRAHLVLDNRRSRPAPGSGVRLEADYELGFDLALFAVLCAVLAFAATRLPSSFLPDEDQGYFMTSIQLPTGATSERTLEVVKAYEAHVATRPALDANLVVLGFSFSGSGFLTSSSL